ncbi:MAG: TatD family hydrolase [Bacteroides sp.]
MDILDIHTHQSENASKAITSVSPSDFNPVEGNCYSVGIHPWSVAEIDGNEWIDELIRVASHPQVVAIGEIGLDKLITTDMTLQTKIVEIQVAVAEQLRLPVVIHCVRAFNELIQLKKKIKPTTPWIIHGFRAKKSIVEQLIKQGFYISFGEKYQQDALCLVPLNKLFLETDESENNIEILYQQIADARSIPYYQLLTQIQQNSKDVFFNH